MQKAIALLALSLTALGHTTDAYAREKAMFVAIDGNTILLIDGQNYYLGLKNHPQVKGFVQSYGFRFKRESLPRGRCMSLGVFKIAEFEGPIATCLNVRISKLDVPDVERIIRYQASCTSLKGDTCKASYHEEVPSFQYAYDVDRRRGLTAIYLAGLTSKNASNTLLLRSGSFFIGK